MADEVLRRMLIGFMRLHVLYHADKEPTCGAELMEELREHGYSIGPGTLYPLLHELLDAGYIRCKEVIYQGKRRKNYTATAKGRMLLGAAREKLRELVGELVDDENALRVRRRRQGSTIGQRRLKPRSSKKSSQD